MDPQNSTPFKEELNKIELALARKLLDELQSGKVSYEDGRAIAQYILMILESVTTVEQLKTALQELSSRWEMFQDIQKVEEIRQDEVSNKDQRIEEIRSKLSKFMQIQ